MTVRSSVFNYIRSAETEDLSRIARPSYHFYPGQVFKVGQRISQSLRSVAMYRREFRDTLDLIFFQHHIPNRNHHHGEDRTKRATEPERSNCRVNLHDICLHLYVLRKELIYC